MEDRLVDLEVRYTHLERQVDELGRVVFEQHNLIDRLTREIVALRASVVGAKEAQGDEPPPHY